MRLPDTDRLSKMDLIQKWKEIGLTQKEFYQQQNIPQHVFYYWHKCYRDQQNKNDTVPVCGKDRQGRYALIRIPSVKSCRKFKDRVKEWLAARIHWKVKDQQAHLDNMLQGFYQYIAFYTVFPSFT